MKLTQNGNSKIHGGDVGISLPAGSNAEIVQNDNSQVAGGRAGIEERDDPAILAIAARLPDAPGDEIRKVVELLRAMRDEPAVAQQATVEQGPLKKWIEMAKDVAPDIVGFVIKTALAAA